MIAVCYVNLPRTIDSPQEVFRSLKCSKEILKFNLLSSRAKDKVLLRDEKIYIVFKKKVLHKLEVTIDYLKY